MEQEKSNQVQSAKTSLNISSKLIQISKTTDLLKAEPIVNHLIKFERNEIEVEIAKHVSICAHSLDIPLDNMKLQILVEDLIDKYKNDSIEDIRECLKKGRRGDYGKNYGKLNMIVISEWMERHLEQKYLAREQLLENEQNESDYLKWESREEYERQAKQPTPKNFKDIIKEKNDGFSKFKSDYIRSKKKQK